MNRPNNAALTPIGRGLLISRVRDQAWTVAAAAQAAGVSRRTVYKWLARFDAEGSAGLQDRSSKPHHSPAACCSWELAAFEERRRQRLPLWRIAHRSVATVARHMRRVGLSRLKSLDPVEPIRRYERAAPGELLHIDTKRLGRIQGLGHRITGDRTMNRNRGIGWDAVHLAIDDHSRVSFALIKPDERPHSCVEFLRQAVAYYNGLGVTIERVMTDNGNSYHKGFKAACESLGIGTFIPARTRPRRTARPSDSCKPGFYEDSHVKRGELLSGSSYRCRAAPEHWCARSRSSCRGRRSASPPSIRRGLLPDLVLHARLLQVTSIQQAPSTMDGRCGKRPSWCTGLFPC